MEHRGAIRLNERLVYGLAIVLEDEVRLRIATGEWETVPLETGAVVVLRVPGAVRRLLLASTANRPDAGYTWIQFLSPVRLDR